MAITNGFACGYADSVTLDTAFPQVSAYILVGTGGDIVFENSVGDAQFISNAGEGYHPIAALKVLTSGTVNGTPRTTTASGMTYLCTNKA